MADLLSAVPFEAAHAALLGDFSCGEEPYEQELADWIRNDSLATIHRGGKVWLYATTQREIVGYGSLSVTRWNYPEPSSKRISLALIPAVAIQKQFWGKPDGPREERYSTQILEHLIVEAATLPIDIPFLGLFVHPDNHRAVKAYERHGFQPFTQIYTDKVTGIVYRSLLRPVAMTPTSP
jgi:GNAT superfamily N-acetyltransferase